MKLTIEIDGQNKDFHFTFGMKIFVQLGKKWGLKTFNEIAERCGKLGEISLTDIPVEAIEVMADILEASGAGESAYQVLDVMLVDSAKMQSFFEAFSGSFPKVAENEKK